VAADAVRRAVMPGRAVFRFCAVYIVLYSFATQIAGGLILFPNFSFPSLGTRWPMRAITEGLAVHLFGTRTPLVYSGNSGDTAFHWIQTFWLLAVSLAVSVAWVGVDTRRGSDAGLHKWLRLFVRFALAGQMFYFGMAKVIPTQFPPPSLVTLVEPVGHLSRTDLLWTFIGSSTAYQMFTGWAEIVAGMLLVVPQTTPLGALIALADMIQVLVLNMAYDVGLKQISLHLVLLSLFLLAPDASRLADVLIRNRPAGASRNPPLFQTPRANRRAWVVQVVFGLYLAAMFTRLAFSFWSGPGGPGSPRSVLYGIWDVDRLSVDGQTRPAVLNDYDRRWRRVIFDAPGVVVVQRTDDSFAHYGASIDVERRSISLKKGNSTIWKTVFRFEQPRADRLVLDGEMDGHEIHAELDQLGLDTLRLLNSSFRWIRPPDPYGG
jgi:uncharacterized membrane protein YphA (DoxX/SURF4 family)